MAMDGQYGAGREVQLRSYRRADLAAMVKLDRVCFAPEFLFGKGAMRGFAEARGAYGLVAERENILVGFAIGQMERGENGARGYCVTLDVAPGERRTGLGRKLLGTLENWAAEQGAREMVLHVFAGNEGAQQFYAASGYRAEGLEPGFYGAGLDAVVCRKALTRD